MDTGLKCLGIIAQFHQLPMDEGQLAHQFSVPGQHFDTTSILRAAKVLTLKAKQVTIPLDKLKQTPLPAIVKTKTGDYIILARVAESETGDIEKFLIHDLRETSPLIIADSVNKTLGVITGNTHKVASLRQELIKATDVNAKQMLYAPVSGYVQELAINTIGGIVTEAQKLMAIVPETEEREVEVVLGNDDIGFVRKDMPAEIKIHIFPFTKYGLIDATVINISGDAIVHKKLGLVYAMHLKMHKNTIHVETKDVKLQPGMAVTA